MRRRTQQQLTQEITQQLNWPIKLRELSIRLQDKSHRIVREALTQYAKGQLDRETLREIIRLSGIPLSRHINPRKYVIYEEYETAEEPTEVIDDDAETIEETTVEVREEYIGERVIRRLMPNDR